jgi:hypothetical protein
LNCLKYQVKPLLFLKILIFDNYNNNVIITSIIEGWNMNETSQSNLTLEQKFKLKALSDDVMKLTLPEAQAYLIEMFKKDMVKDNLIKEWMKR